MSASAAAPALTPETFARLVREGRGLPSARKGDLVLCLWRRFVFAGVVVDVARSRAEVAFVLRGGARQRRAWFRVRELLRAPGVRGTPAPADDLVRLGELELGARFVTAGTKRAGVVLELARHGAVEVELEGDAPSVDPIVRKQLSAAVLVRLVAGA